MNLMLSPRESPSEEVTELKAIHSILVLLVVFMGAGGVVVLFSRSFAAQRLCAAILEGGDDWSYVETLLRNTALCALASSLGFFVLCARSGGLHLTWLRHWFLWSSVGLYLTVSLSLWWYVNDDAAISFTYAKNLAHGHGLVYNVGDSPVEGYSNPLWVMLLAIGRFLGMDIVPVSKFLGLVCGVGCLLCLAIAVWNEHLVTWLVLVLTASNASVIIWYNSGLESSLHGLLLILVLLLLRNPDGLQRLHLLSLVAVLVLLTLSRPEGILFALGVGSYLAYRTAFRGQSRYHVLVAWLVPSLALAGLTAFRSWYFDDLLPNTYYVKATGANPLRLLNPYSGGWTYVRKAAEGCGWTIMIMPLLLLVCRRKSFSPLVGAGLMIVLTQLFFVVAVGGDWMAEYRFIAPIVPIASIIIAIGLRELWYLVRNCGCGIQRAFILCLSPVLLIVGSQVRALVIFEQRPTTPMQDVARIGEYFVNLARRAGIETPSLLSHDAGGTAYVAGIQLIDLYGLCDRTVAKHWRDREIMQRYLFQEKRPTFIYSAKVFADRIGLETFEEFQREYVRLPAAPTKALEGYIRVVRRDVYPKLFPENAGTGR